MLADELLSSGIYRLYLKELKIKHITIVVKCFYLGVLVVVTLASAGLSHVSTVEM